MESLSKSTQHFSAVTEKASRHRNRLVPVMQKHMEKKKRGTESAAFDKRTS